MDTNDYRDLPVENGISPETETNDAIATEISVLEFTPDGNDEQWRPLHSYLYQLGLFYGYDWNADVPNTAQDWGWIP